MLITGNPPLQRNLLASTSLVSQASEAQWNQLSPQRNVTLTFSPSDLGEVEANGLEFFPDNQELRPLADQETRIPGRLSVDPSPKFRGARSCGSRGSVVRVVASRGRGSGGKCAFVERRGGSVLGDTIHRHSRVDSPPSV